MKKFYFAVLAIAVFSLSASGCVSISKYTPPTNEEDKPVMKMGGTGKEQPKVKVEIELLEKPDLSRFSDPKTVDTADTGNKGIFSRGIFSKSASVAVTEEPVAPKVWWSTMPEEQVDTMVEAVPKAVEEAPVVKKYKVKKGQTLADVSMDVYGTTKKWKKIYNANKGKIKNPDKIYAGQVLDIPQEGSIKHLK